MKKFSILLTMTALMVSSSVFAGSIDYLSNQSAKFLMNQASTARTDGADIVAYNPAGTALMGEGFFIDVSNQTLLKYYKQDVEVGAPFDEINSSYEQDEPTILLPNVYVAYNAGLIGVGKLAVFGQAGVVAGGGSLEWDGVAGVAATVVSVGGSTGSPTVRSITGKIEGSSVYYGFGGGAAYSFLEDMISVSAGVRYTMPKRSTSVDGTVEYTNAGGQEWTLNIDTEHEFDAAGYTPIFGLDIKPMKELTIGIRYELETKLEFDYSQKSNSITASGTGAATDLDGDGTEYVSGLVAAGGLANSLNRDGMKSNFNLPQILSIGIEYVVMPELTVSAGTNIYFLGKADMNLPERTNTGTAYETDYSKYFGTGWEGSLAAVYTVMPALKIGGGFTYTDQGAKDKLYTDTATLLNVSGNPVLDSIMIGLGATYTVIPNLDITLAGAWVHYLPEDVDIPLSATLTEKVTYKKEVYNIALGASYKM